MRYFFIGFFIGLYNRGEINELSGCTEIQLSLKVARHGTPLLEHAHAQMPVVVDTNSGEDAVHAALCARLGDAQVRRARLDVGDFLIECDDGTRVIVERKHVNDLIGSLGDSRYREQKARQLAAVDADESGRTTVVWAVEGPLPGWHASIAPTGFPASQLEAAVISTAVRDAIPVLRCRDAEAVAETVAYLHARAAAGELDGAARTQRKVAAGYSSFVHVKKAANGDPALTFKSMLSTVPGLSMTKAAALIERFPSLTRMVAELSPLSHKEATKRLADVQCGARRLGPAVAAKLVQIFKESA